MKPLVVDLFCGLGGFTEGFLAEGYRAVGFDIERHAYGEHRYPADLVLQDVRTIHGKQLKDAAIIVASSPCQEYSYMAMPWSRGKQIAKALRGQGDFPEGYVGSRTIEELNDLFSQPRRIQLEACEAAGRYIPMIQENVRGAQPWVGRAQWAFGSFMLWGDVPALMPVTHRGVKVTTMGAGWYPPDHPKHVRGLGFNTHADRATRIETPPCAYAHTPRTKRCGRASVGETKGISGVMLPVCARHMKLYEQLHMQDVLCERATKNTGGSWFNVGSPGQKVTNQNPVHAGQKTAGLAQQRDGHSHTRHLTNQAEHDGVKGFTPDQQPFGENVGPRRHGSKSSARKAAAARIAKIPFALSSFIAYTYYPNKGVSYASSVSQQAPQLRRARHPCVSRMGRII